MKKILEAIEEKIAYITNAEWYNGGGEELGMNILLGCLSTIVIIFGIIFGIIYLIKHFI